MILELRPEVAKFAQLMEERLLANEHKDIGSGGMGGWKNDNPWDLYERLLGEAGELAKAMAGQTATEMVTAGPYNPQRINELKYEAADVANFAMMIIDSGGYLLDE